MIREFPDGVWTFERTVQSHAKKKKKEEKKKKNRTRNEIPTVTGARVYAAVHDITLYQVLAHHGSKVNSVLFVLPATCRSFALIYSPRCFSLPPS